ncbi:hypothetical protein H9S87_18725 (plasmid) [Bacillus pumilus]|uniref:hypothetical protein n=1 Tax=Bacillus pumilus TaxID=1408 RepID=UPI0016583375|nr:hypothetical protein [Bacillus pumilus]QNP18319.1 hypothetical protein H9S87_18725 [Bacillus pumilus]
MRKVMMTSDKIKSLKAAASLLNSCEMLVVFTVEKEGNRTVLHILADDKKLEYSVIKDQDMLNFLNDLKQQVDHPEDVEEVLMEFKDLK